MGAGDVPGTSLDLVSSDAYAIFSLQSSTAWWALSPGKEAAPPTTISSTQPHLFLQGFCD